MSYANLPASMNKPRTDLEWSLPRVILVSAGSDWPINSIRLIEPRICLGVGVDRAVSG